MKRKKIGTNHKAKGLGERTGVVTYRVLYLAMGRQRNDIVYEENNEGDSSGCPQSFHLSSRLYLLNSRYGASTFKERKGLNVSQSLRINM